MFDNEFTSSLAIKILISYRTILTEILSNLKYTDTLTNESLKESIKIFFQVSEIIFLQKKQFYEKSLNEISLLICLKSVQILKDSSIIIVSKHFVDYFAIYGETSLFTALIEEGNSSQLMKMKRVSNYHENGIDSLLELAEMEQINIIEIEKIIDELLNALQCYDPNDILLHESLAMVTTSLSGILGNLLYLVSFYSDKSIVVFICSSVSLLFFQGNNVEVELIRETELDSYIPFFTTSSASSSAAAAGSSSSSSGANMASPFHSTSSRLFSKVMEVFSITTVIPFSFFFGI